MKRLNISASDELCSLMDKFTEEHNISRSRLIETAVTQYISAMEEMPTLTNQLNELVKALNALSVDSGRREA